MAPGSRGRVLTPSPWGLQISLRVDVPCCRQMLSLTSRVKMQVTVQPGLGMSLGC